MIRLLGQSLLLLVLAASAARAASPVYGSVTLGYDSRYVLYGYRLSRHLWHADVYLGSALDESTVVWGGAWYGYLTDGTYHEVDVYAGLDRTLGHGLSAGLAYSMFNYLEVPFPTSEQAHELAVHLTWTRGPATLALRHHYDSEAEGALLRGIASLGHPLTETWSLSLSAEAGYAFGYFIDGNLPNHALVTLRLPWVLGGGYTLSPFLAHAVPLDAIKDFEDEETYGGVSLTRDF